MNISLFVGSISLAVLLPVLAVSYLRPILVKVLKGFCDADGGAEFWVRSAYLLAVCGTLLLMLSFGRFEPFVDPVDAMQRSLWLVFAGIFVTVAFIARNVWSQVRPLLEGRSAALASSATLKTRVGSAS